VERTQTAAASEVLAHLESSAAPDRKAPDGSETAPAAPEEAPAADTAPARIEGDPGAVEELAEEARPGADGEEPADATGEQGDEPADEADARFFAEEKDSAAPVSRRTADEADQAAAELEAMLRSPAREARRAQIVRVLVGVVTALVVGSAGIWIVNSMRRPEAPLPVPALSATPVDTPAPIPTVSSAPAVESATPPPAPPPSPSGSSSAAAAPTASASATAHAGAGHPPAPPPPGGEPTPPPSPPPADDSSAPLTTRITSALEAGQTGKAVQLAQQLTAGSPGSASAWHLRGAAEQAAGRSGKASFRKCAELSAPDSPLGSECRSLAGME
jgi:hypothetical protein